VIADAFFAPTEGSSASLCFGQDKQDQQDCLRILSILEILSNLLARQNMRRVDQLHA